MLKVGDRVAAYNHRNERVGKGTVVMVQGVTPGEYCKVRLDGGDRIPAGVVMAFRKDKCKKLVKAPLVDDNPKVAKVSVVMTDGTEYKLADTLTDILTFAGACNASESPQARQWGTFLETHAPRKAV